MKIFNLKTRNSWRRYGLIEKHIPKTWTQRLPKCGRQTDRWADRWTLWLSIHKLELLCNPAKKLKHMPLPDIHEPLVNRRLDSPLSFYFWLAWHPLITANNITKETKKAKKLAINVDLDCTRSTTATHPTLTPGLQYLSLPPSVDFL